MKNPMPDIIGNVDLRRRLCDDIVGGVSSHAYILSGPRGSGKHTIAVQFAAAVACEAREENDLPLPCGGCRMCKKIFDGNCPDVLFVKKDGMSVKIDQIRALQSDVRKVPNDLEDKFYIIEDAQTMTEEAQNAFLLTLEEPPSYVHFFLLCNSTEGLLETIRSRAPVLRTEPIPGDRIREHLLRVSPRAADLHRSAPHELDEILIIADGSIGRALELIDEKEREPYIRQRHYAEALVTAALAHKKRKLIELINEFSPKQEELLAILSAAQTALRDLIALKQSEKAPLCFFTDRAAATELAFSNSLSAMLTTCDVLEETAALLARNANIKLTLTVMTAKL